jgi:hypothetical protein
MAGAEAGGVNAESTVTLFCLAHPPRAITAANAVTNAIFIFATSE